MVFVVLQVLVLDVSYQSLYRIRINYLRLPHVKYWEIVFWEKYKNEFDHMVSCTKKGKSWLGTNNNISKTKEV